MMDDFTINEWFAERVCIKIADAGLPDLEAIRQAYHETKLRFGEVTEQVKSKYRKAVGLE
jgi:hypothetical protein